MRKIIHIIVFMIPVFCHGQMKSIGTPNIISYQKSDYNAGTQNWGIAQDKNGLMYFANNDGVLRFDGVHWDLIPVFRSSPVRSIAIDGDDNIYVGLMNDFGMLEKTPSGVLEYKSFRSLLPSDFGDFDDVWKIYQINENIFFQSYDYVFVLNNGQIQIIRPEKRFQFSFKVKERLFLHEPGVGLFEFINGVIHKVPWANELADKEIWSILELNGNHLLIVTSRNGIYKFENGRLQKWNTAVCRFLENYKLFSSAKIGNNYYAFGTILNGVIISDSDGNVIQHINKNSGLQNNTILSIFSDSNNNLWLGLDNGIDYIEINSPLSFISDFDGLGTGYCARVFNGKLYLGTNQGLFVKSFNNFSANIEKFELIRHTAGQVWSLDVFDEKLICGHNYGTFEITGNNVRLIGENDGGWTYIQPHKNPDLLLGGHYNGLQLFKKENGKWNFFKNVAGFSESSRFLLQENDTIFWISHGGKGIFRLKLSADLDSVESYSLYTAKNGLPSDDQNILFQFNEKPYFSAIGGIYAYESASDSFIPATGLNETFNFNGRLKTFKPDINGNIWFIADNESGVLRLNEDLTYTKITTPFKQLDNRYVNEFEFIYPYNNDHVFIGIDNGFAHYSSKLSKLYSEPFQSFITKMEMPYLDSTLLIYNRVFENEFRIPFRKNALRFHFAAPFYEGHSQLCFSYFLENYDDEWSDWTPSSYRDFTNLPEGHYTFKLKAKNLYGFESREAAFHFEIIPPWYRSAVAYYVYLALFILAVVFTLKFILYRMELAKQKEIQKHQAELIEKEERFQRQAIIAEKEIIRLKNEKLQTEMVHRDKELANQTMSIIHKNKFLVKLKEELLQAMKNTSDGNLKTKLSILNQRINKEIDNKQQNQLFETYFDEVHDDFFQRLRQQFPNLSPRETRLCAYIRMNLSSKEIAALLNISDRGVEIGRYRLRKKLNLPQEVNLSTFLSNI